MQAQNTSKRVLVSSTFEPKVRREEARVPKNQATSKPMTKASEKDELLLMATERFCGLNKHSRLSINQFKEAFYSLAGAVENETLAQISLLMKDEPNSPREILLYLALEPISVCGPLLRDAPRFSQLDLIRLVTKCGLNHATEIAKRADLGPSLVKHLRHLNDGEVNKALKANRAILDDLSKRSLDLLFDTITTASHTIIDEKDDGLEQEENLVVGSVSAEPKTAHATEFAKNSLLDAAARGGKTQRQQPKAAPNQTASEKSAGGLTTEQFGTAFEKSALARSRQGMCALLQKQFDLSFDTTQQVFDDKSGDTLAVLLKSIDMSASKANRIALLTFPQIGLSVQNTRRAIDFFKQLKIASCKAAVAQWPKHSSKPALHQPLHSEANGARHLETAKTEIRSTQVQNTPSKAVNS